MGRVDEFKKIRRRKERYLAAVVIPILLLLAGIYAADVSTNALLRNEKRLNIITIRNNTSYYEVRLFNKTYHIKMK